MKNSRVKWLLFFSIFVTISVPLTMSLWLVNHALDTSLNLGFNRQVEEALEAGSQSLKSLKSFDPENEAAYRTQFEKIESLKFIYSRPDLVKGGISKSLKIYFLMGLAVAVMLSILIASILSRKIAVSYEKNFNELLRHKDRVRYLEDISSWQEFARFLAHEIKNPLTPIELLVTSLGKAYASKSDVEFKAQLEKTETMVGEELSHLKQIVNRFGEFTKLPTAELKPTNLAVELEKATEHLSLTFPKATIRYQSDGIQPFVNLDVALFKQCLTNIVRNGVEANLKSPVTFEISLKSDNGSVWVEISNDGQPIPPTTAEKIFEPYFTTKAGKENMGLGLSIVKKAILEHGGDIQYLELAGRPTFQIGLRRL